jgi:hypothetical protein
MFTIRVVTLGVDMGFPEVLVGSENQTKRVLEGVLARVVGVGPGRDAAPGRAGGGGFGRPPDTARWGS